MLALAGSLAGKWLVCARQQEGGRFWEAAGAEVNGNALPHRYRTGLNSEIPKSFICQKNGRKYKDKSMPAQNVSKLLLQIMRTFVIKYSVSKPTH